MTATKSLFVSLLTAQLIAGVNAAVSAEEMKFAQLQERARVVDRTPVSVGELELTSAVPLETTPGGTGDSQLVPGTTTNAVASGSLVEVVRKGDSQGVKALLEEKIDVNLADEKGRTALMVAAIKGDADMVKLLIDAGADWHMKDADGKTAQQLATTSNNDEIAKLIGEHAMELLMQKNPDFAFFAAIKRGDLEAAKKAFEKGADNDVKTKNPRFGGVGHQTALMLAAKRNDINILKYLLDNRAHVNAVDSKGKAAIDYYPSEECASLLRAKGAKPYAAKTMNESLIRAIEKNDADVVRACLDKGADPNHYGYDGEPALVEAVKYSSLEIMTNLVGHGASPNFGCDPGFQPEFAKSDGATPLYWAGLRGPSLAKWLINCGAKVNIKTRNGTTPLMYAASAKGGAETLKVLLTAGAKVNAQRADGSTALSTAVAEDNAETIKVLIDSGADTNVKDSAGRPLFVSAAADGHADGVKLLIKKVTDPTLKDLALQTASYGGHATVVKILIENGANVNAKDSKGNSAVVYAAEGGNDNVVKILIQAGAKDLPSGYDKSGDPVSTKELTKAEWKEKLAKRVPAYAAAGAILVPQTDFVRWFGNPVKTQTVGDRAFWYYQCTDGTIQLDLDGGNLHAGTVAGRVNDY